MKSIEDQAMEYAESLNDIADMFALPTGTTSAAIVRKVKESREALEAADECLALIEDVGHGAMMDNVTVARRMILAAISPANAKRIHPHSPDPQ